MFSINMRIFKTVLLIAYLGASVRCLPVDGESSSTESKTEVFVPSTTEAAAATAAATTTTTATTTIADEPTALPAAAAAAQSDTNYYDQRQNGSENYRVHVDGVVLVFAPVEALLLAGATAGGTTASSTLPIPGQGLGSLLPLRGSQPHGEKPNADLQNKTEPASSKTIHRPPFRLAHLLAPFLRRLYPEHNASVH